MIKCNEHSVQFGKEQGILRLTYDWLATATTCERPRKEHMLEVQTT